VETGSSFTASLVCWQDLTWSGFEISAQRVSMCCWHEHVTVWQGNVLHVNDLMFDDDLAMQLECRNGYILWRSSNKAQSPPQKNFAL
jgi:hypothetical protein